MSKHSTICIKYGRISTSFQMASVVFASFFTQPVFGWTNALGGRPCKKQFDWHNCLKNNKLSEWITSKISYLRKQNYTA
jgi:hypothetical protein